MTDGLDQLMADAGLNLLRADAGLTIIDGAVQNPTPALPYVVVWTAIDWPPDDPQRDALDNLSQHAEVRWFCHIVAENMRQWRAIAQRVRTQLLNVRPTIAGMSPGLIRFENGSAPPEHSEILGSVELNGVCVYRLTCDT
jgi:hypothetical protein